jgi:glycosyltransferase involved in cell wall biosynthesis
LHGAVPKVIPQVRIGFDAKRLFNNFTGLGNYSRFIADGLAERYPENEYWLYSPKVKRHPETEHFWGTPFSIRQPQKPWHKTFPSVWRSVSLGSVAGDDGVQVLHGLSNELPITKPSSLRTVLTVHDLIFKRFPSYYSGVDRAIYAAKLRTSLNRADRIVAVSQQTASDLREFEKIGDDRLVVIGQGCHSVFRRSYTDFEVESIKSKYDLPDRFVLCVGTMEPRKNAALLIKALSIMREKVFVVIAGKATTYAGELKQEVQKRNLESFVRFIYHIPFADLPLLYRAATLFVYPSVFEGFGIPIVEAIASGLPVIASKTSSLTEAGGPDCLYVDPSNPEALAVMIAEVLGDEELRRTMVSKSAGFILRFEPRVIAEQLMNLYRAL